MFVLLTWVLEATSYCTAEAGGAWQARAALAAKPHLAALLRPLGRPILAGAGGPGRYCGDDRVLRAGARLSAPWNLALGAAAASGAVMGTGLARPRDGGAWPYLVTAAVGVAAALPLARCRSSRARWGVTAAGFPALVAGALAGAAGRPVLAGVPWAAIAVTCSGFSACSYRDLIEAGPRLVAALWRAGGLSAMGYREARVGAAPGGRPIGASWLSNAFSRA
jgi:hypothetical protein